MATEHLYVGSDNVVELDALTDALTEMLITGATVTARVVDSGGTQVLVPVALSDVAGEAGNYRGSFTAVASNSLVAGEVYCLEVTAVNGGVTRIFAEEALALKG